MNPAAWNAVGLVLAGLVSFAVSRLHARAQNRKTDAESRMLEIQAQDLITKGLERGLAQRDKQISKQDRQISDFERRLDAVDSDLQDAHEQNDLLAAELAEERKKVSLITAALETAQAHLAAALAELDTVKEQLKSSLSQNAILREHFARMDVWLVHHWATNGHTEETDKPPTLAPFDTEGDTA
jgi:chromosome segregation ATPase